MLSQVVMTSVTRPAGTHGSPSTASVVLDLALLALTFAAIAFGARFRRRREAPLRTEIRARPVVDFRTRVDVKVSFLGIKLPANGPLCLTVRGDAFEVSHPFPPARLMFGQQYCYRAGDTTIEMAPGLRHEWIGIGGQPAGTGARIWIGQRKMNRQVWDALVNAGAHPLGPAQPGGS